MSEFHDDIFEAEKTEIKNYHSYVGPWTCSPTKDKVTGGVKQLKRLADAIDWKHGKALHVIDFLYLFNSEVFICGNSNNNDKLFILPQAEVVIDLFHYVKEKDYQEVMSLIRCQDYIFYSLKDACDAIKVLQAISPIKRFPISIRDKNDIAIIARGSHLFGENNITKEKDSNFQTNLFNLLFYGEYNWQCNQSYTQAMCDLEQSLLPYHIFCYEDSSFIKKEGGYCIEKLTLDESKFDFDKYDWNTPTRIAIFSKDGDAVKFYGVFILDKDKSNSNNALTFKHCSNELS